MERALTGLSNETHKVSHSKCGFSELISLMVASWYNEQDSKRETNGGNRFECGTLRTWSAVQLWAKVVVLYDIVIVSIVTIR